MSHIIIKSLVSTTHYYSNLSHHSPVFDFNVFLLFSSACKTHLFCTVKSFYSAVYLYFRSLSHIQIFVYTICAF